MQKSGTKTDGFYKFIVLVGLAVGMSGAGLTAWNAQRSQESVFALESEVVALAADAAKQKSQLGHIQKYLDEMTAKVRTATDLGSPHHNFLVDEVKSTTKRVEQAQLEQKRTSAILDTKSSQIAMLRSQRGENIQRGGIAAGAGLGLTALGFILWYWRVQRYSEIESHARMTTHLVEEIVARSRTEAMRIHDVSGESVDNIAVVNSSLQEVAVLPKEPLQAA
jgi:hypothetical protein